MSVDILEDLEAAYWMEYILDIRRTGEPVASLILSVARLYCSHIALVSSLFEVKRILLVVSP